MSKNHQGLVITLQHLEEAGKAISLSFDLEKSSIEEGLYLESGTYWNPLTSDKDSKFLSQSLGMRAWLSNNLFNVECGSLHDLTQPYGSWSQTVSQSTQPNYVDVKRAAIVGCASSYQRSKNLEG